MLERITVDGLGLNYHMSTGGDKSNKVKTHHLTSCHQRVTPAPQYKLVAM